MIGRDAPSHSEMAPPKSGFTACNSYRLSNSPATIPPILVRNATESHTKGIKA